MPLHPLAVDRFASALLDDMAPGDWASMRDVVSDLVTAFRGPGGRPGSHPGPDAREVVGDLIVKLGAPEVGSALQARLWTLSDRPKHRAIGEAWLAAHPQAAAAPDVQLDDELRFVAEGPFTQDDEAALPRTLRFTAAFDGEAAVWTAIGPSHIAAEAPTQAELLERLCASVPDLLESRHGRVGRCTLIVDWQGPGSEHSTTTTVG